MVGSGGTGISGESDIVATMGDSEFGGITSSTRTSRRDGRTQDGSRGTTTALQFAELAFMKDRT